ncbi:hypothetical protein HY285_03385 [Candidatus Peregrinibacteria bacterium]|nr:hypothetical protein [Candidatus Peregrinibacteria bacterium]MBI3816558.1 hypothetical protein [Candidatus Peregrinibacteria bacterium]
MITTKKRFTEDGYRREPWFRSLCAALLSNKNEEEMANFLRDVATLSELQAWSERLEVARQLVQGLSYRQVAANTGASTTTVTRVAKFIENGPGGYRKFLHAHRHHRMLAKPLQRSDQVNTNTPSSHSKVSSDSSPSAKKDVLRKYLGR